MKVFYSQHHHRHAPVSYLADGTLRPVPESLARVEAIAAALRQTHDLQPADDALDPLTLLRAVHASDYLDYLKTIHAVFAAEFGTQDVLPDTFYPPGRAPRRPSKPSAQAGHYCFDMAAPISAGTWDAALASARCAILAAQAVTRGDRAAYALCRPPGHHAGPAYCGGFCYLNNAAVAAQTLLAAGLSRVAILDIDYHHGNGTQDIFYRRSDVFFASIHADPNTQYPYFWGYADETGEGAGQNCNANFPLPRGTLEPAWLATTQAALARIAAFGPQALIISFGADIHETDTVGDFKISFDGIRRAADAIAQVNLPTVIIQEGGYNISAIGPAASAFLSAF